MKYLALALIPIIGASVLLWGQPYKGTGTTVLVTNDWNVNSLALSNRYPFKPNSNFQRFYLGGKASDYTVFYYTNHEVFVADSRYGPTNIVISNDYKGTITIHRGYSLRIITNAP